MFRAAQVAITGTAREPPIDVIETEREAVIFVALPGVDPERVQAAIEGARDVPPPPREMSR